MIKYKKLEGEPGKGCKSSFIAGILLFHAIWNWCSQKGERMKIQYELARVEAAKRKRKLKKRWRGYEILVKGAGGLYFSPPD